MSIVFDDVSYSAPGFINTTTFAHTVPALGVSPVIFVHTNLVPAPPAKNVTVCTYGGDALAQLDNQTFDDGGNPQYQEVWYLAAPKTGLNNVVVTWSGVGELTATAIVWLGVDQDTPVGVDVGSAQNSGVGNTLNVILASQIGDLCVDFLSVKNTNASATAAAGQIERTELQSNEVVSSNRHRDETSEEVGAAAVTMSWTFGANLAAGLIGVPLRAAAVARARATKYFFPFWNASPKLFDANGKIVDPSDVLADEWVEAQGLAFPSAENPDSFIEDPSRSKIIEVNASQVSARNEDEHEPVCRSPGFKSGGRIMNYLISPVMCYSVEGPTATVNDEVFWRTLMSAPEDDEGVISGTYTYVAGVATITNKGVTEVGPLTGVYDPEWDAFLAGELI